MYTVTFSNGAKPMKYSTLREAIVWGLAPRWAATNVWRTARDGNREAVVLNRYPTKLGEALGLKA